MGCSFTFRIKQATCQAQTQMTIVAPLSCILLVLLSGCVAEGPSAVVLGDDPAPEAWLRTANTMKHVSEAIELDLGLKAGLASPTAVIESLVSRYPHSPHKVDEFFARWLEGSWQRRQYFDRDAPDGRGEIIEQKMLSDINRRYHLACLPNDFARHPFPYGSSPEIRIGDLLSATKEITEPNSLGTFSVLATSQDLKWAETTIYWLIQISSNSPEYLSADIWSGRRRVFAQKILEESPELSRFYVSTGEVLPCFEWDASSSALPISRHAQLYFAAELAPEDDPFMLNHEAALFWAVTLTLRFKSRHGAEQLMLFRRYQARTPNNAFWKAAEKELSPLLSSTKCH